MDSTKILWISPYGMLQGETESLRERYGAITIYQMASRPTFFFEIMNFSKEIGCNVIAYTNIHESIEDDLIRNTDNSVCLLKSYRATRYTGKRYYDPASEEYIYEIVPVHQYWEDVKTKERR